MNIVELYNKLATAKIISKKKLEELGLTEFLMKKYAGRETASQYRDLDNEGLIFELASRLENKPMSVVEQVKFEKEYLQYVVYSNPRVNHSFYIVRAIMSDLDSLYFCKNDDNTCDLKESCRRFLEADGQEIATLFKAACTKNNNHLLVLQLMSQMILLLNRLKIYI